MLSKLDTVYACQILQHLLHIRENDAKEITNSHDVLPDVTSNKLYCIQQNNRKKQLHMYDSNFPGP